VRNIFELGLDFGSAGLVAMSLHMGRPHSGVLGSRWGGGDDVRLFLAGAR
jgi:hypothetical protein